jgi:hypothetical protein
LPFAKGGRTPVDLLPDREKSTLENWLKEHPGAKIISRDRSAVGIGFRRIAAVSCGRDYSNLSPL